MLPGSSARCATSANSTRSAASPSRRRPAATRRSAAPIPSRSQSRSSTHAPPKRRESSTSTSPACAAAIACSGSRNREIEATSRASASRSTVSARPKLWITFAEGTPVTGWRSLCASCRYDTVDPSRLRPLRLPQVHAYTVSTYPLLKSSDTPEVVCLHEFAVSSDSASLLPAQSLRATPKYAYELRKSGQGLIESTNTKIRVLTRIAFGFHNPAALIALAMLALGGHRPTLPGRG